MIGSNNWAVDAAHSASGRALVANDMHLGHRRAEHLVSRVDGLPRSGRPARRCSASPASRSRACRSPSSAATATWRGASPTPAATGATWSASSRIRATRALPHARGPEAVRPRRRAHRHQGRPPAHGHRARHHLGAHRLEGRRGARVRAALGRPRSRRCCRATSSRPERTRTVDEMLIAVAGLGLPNQNVTMADAAGRIAWTMGGAIPRRRGLDGFTSESWADGSRGWDGYLEPTEFPRIVDPEQGRIWTANAPGRGRRAARHRSATAATRTASARASSAIG